MFESAKAKLGRAHLLHHEIRRCFGEYVGSRPFMLTGGSRYQGFFPGSLQITKPLPGDDMIMITMGDLLHNLRSALDHCVFEVLKNDRIAVNKRKVSFPISSKDREEYLLNLEKLKPAPDIREALEGIEAYPGGANEALVGIHHLNILDKHRESPSYLPSITVSGLRAEWSDPMGSRPSPIDPVTAYVEHSGVNPHPTHGPGIYGAALFGRFSHTPEKCTLDSSNASYEFKVTIETKTYTPDPTLESTIDCFLYETENAIRVIEDAIHRRSNGATKSQV